MLVFLEDCKPGGCVYYRSLFEDSRTNRSSIIGPSTAALPEFQLPEAFWDELVDCVREAYRPFAVEVTDVDPGTEAHLEHVIAGLREHIGQGGVVVGVSPYNCDLFRNSTSFTLAGHFGTEPSESVLRDLCWSAVHEIGHQHGLDHHAYLPDAMTYLEGCGSKRLPALDVPCGETSPEPCLCGGTMENSYARIREAQGASEFLFGDGFEVVEPGFNCGWTGQTPPPPPFAPELAPDQLGSRCGTLEPGNPGLRPRVSPR